MFGAERIEHHLLLVGKLTMGSLLKERVLVLIGTARMLILCDVFKKKNDAKDIAKFKDT